MSLRHAQNTFYAGEHKLCCFISLIVRTGRTYRIVIKTDSLKYSFPFSVVATCAMSAVQGEHCKEVTILQLVITTQRSQYVSFNTELICKKIQFNSILFPLDEVT